MHTHLVHTHLTAQQQVNLEMAAAVLVVLLHGSASGSSHQLVACLVPLALCAAKGGSASIL